MAEPAEQSISPERRPPPTVSAAATPPQHRGASTLFDDADNDVNLAMLRLNLSGSGPAYATAPLPARLDVFRSYADDQPGASHGPRVPSSLEGALSHAWASSSFGSTAIPFSSQHQPFEQLYQRNQSYPYQQYQPSHQQGPPPGRQVQNFHDQPVSPPYDLQLRSDPPLPQTSTQTVPMPREWSQFEIDRLTAERVKPHSPLLSTTNIYLRGLSPETIDEDLRNICRRFGKIVSAKAIIDHERHLCKGYGFVMFESEAAALCAVEGLTAIGWQATFAKITKPHQELQATLDPTNLYLSNLPRAMDEEMLTSMLSKYGPVVSCRVLRDATGASRGVGLARMESRLVCSQVIASLHGRSLPGSLSALVVKFADGGSNRKPRYQNRPYDDREQPAPQLVSFRPGPAHSSEPPHYMYAGSYMDPRPVHEPGYRFSYVPVDSMPLTAPRPQEVPWLPNSSLDLY